jgi:antitoxin VapB
MSLNIKDPEAHELAQALAKTTGESMTRAVTVALRERLDRIKKTRKASARAKALLAIGREFCKNLQGPHLDHGDFLYDEHGLPK